MSPAGRTVYVFGVYVIVLGAILIGAPNVLLSLFRLGQTSEPWIHVVGVPVMSVGMLSIASARGEQMAFIRATVWVRTFVFLAFIAMAFLKITPPILALFGVVDLAGAAWTFTTLRQTGKVMAAS